MDDPAVFQLKSPTADGAVFQRFSLLRAELRLRIWTMALQRQRLIRVGIVARFPSPSAAAEGYSVYVDDRKLYSKLMRVNRESRQAVLAFYRIPLPCTFSPVPPSRAKIAKPPTHTLYLNPDFDCLEIIAPDPHKENLVRFLHDLKTVHDPLHEGLRNLAVAMGTLSMWDTRRDVPLEINDDDRAAFAATLAQLREVFFVLAPHEGRQNFGQFRGMNCRQKFYNRSVPILARVPTFERCRDPRPIAEDLKRVYVGVVDPRFMVSLWHQMLQQLDVPKPSTTHYQYLVAFTPSLEPGRVPDLTSVKTWLRKEESWWREEGDPSQSLGEDVVATAVGFWLFPLEALTTHAEDIGMETQFLDLTGHWPDLALMDVT